MAERCPKCRRGVLRQQVSVFVECSTDNFNLSKKGIRSRDVVVLGAGWPTAWIYCTECAYAIRLKGDAK